MSSTEAPANKTTDVGIPYTARRLIRHAYNQAVTQAARLASFSISPILPEELSAIEERQDELAIDDLIAFALHARRLVETSGTEAQIGDAKVLAFVGREMRECPVIRIINTVIHHRRIEILRRASDYSREPLDTEESIQKWLKERQEGRHPVVAVRSDRGGMIAFRIDYFVLAAAKGVISPIVEYCEEHDLLLEEEGVD